MWDDLKAKIKILNETIWDRRATWPAVEQWLANLPQDTPETQSERLHALFLLSQFMYFGAREIRQLIRALYRDVFAYPIIEGIRRAHADTIDRRVIGPRFSSEIRATRFLGIGNPSESGTHLLYYFRQENRLPRRLFVNPHELFTTDAAGVRACRFPRVTRYVFLDDLCASGQQAEAYAESIVKELKTLQPSSTVHYYVLFATSGALQAIRATAFDRVQALVELDTSFRCFDDASRYFVDAPPEIDKEFAREFCTRYGRQLLPSHPLGYRDGQLLLGFHHNTPDNTLPIIWHDRPNGRWRPIFPRYPKSDW